MPLTVPADELLQRAALARPQSPAGAQAPVSVQRVINRLDQRIYRLARAMEYEIAKPNGNTLDVAAELQAMRQARAVLVVLRDGGFEIDTRAPDNVHPTRSQHG